MEKPFLLFAGEHYASEGGWTNFIGAFASMMEAMQAPVPTKSWKQVVDVREHKIVYRVRKVIKTQPQKRIVPVGIVDVAKALKDGGTNWQQASFYSDRRLLRIRGFGKKHLALFREALADERIVGPAPNLPEGMEFSDTEVALISAYGSQERVATAAASPTPHPDHRPAPTPAAASKPPAG